MQYFDTLPYMVVNGPTGNQIAAKNILINASVLPTELQQPSVYYKYDIQEGDTPEIIAAKYYGDVYRYWLVLFSNQMIDPQWNWPMSYQVFEDYMNDKYADIAAQNNMTAFEYTSSTIYEYQKIITTTDSLSLNVTTDIYVIDHDTYNSLMEDTITVQIQPTKWNPNGYVTIATSKKPVSIYDWEQQKNENNRSIKLINNQYVSLFEAEFKSLVNK